MPPGLHGHGVWVRVFYHAAANVMVSSQQEMGPRPRAGRL